MSENEHFEMGRQRLSKSTLLGPSLYAKEDSIERGYPAHPKCFFFGTGSFLKVIALLYYLSQAALTVLNSLIRIAFTTPTDDFLTFLLFC
jgi:hypothetical protein